MKKMDMIIGIGEYTITDDINAVIKTYALSSCVALTVYDPIKKILGMVHIVLPSCEIMHNGGDINPAYYADTAVPMLINKVCLGYGCNKEGLELKLYGGAKSVRKKDVFNIVKGKGNEKKIKPIKAKTLRLYNEKEVSAKKEKIMDNQFRLLFTGKSDANTDLIYLKIRDFGYNVMPIYADSVDKIKKYLANSSFDIMVSLHNMSCIATEEIAMVLSEFEATIPWIMVYRNANRDEIIQTIDAGCKGAININDLDRLEFVIHSLLIEAKRVHKHEEEQVKLIAEKEELALILGSIRIKTH